MTDEEKENIKYRLSDIGKQVGELALEYIADLEKENAELKEQIEELQLNLKSRNDLVEELTMQIENYKLSENESKEIIVELKAQIEKMKNFIFEEIDFCFYCPLTDTCLNNEGTCPYANITEEEQKKLLAKWICK